VPSIDCEPSRHNLWRTTACVLVVALGACFLVKNRHELPAAWAELRGANPRWLVVGTLAALASIVNKGMLHSAAQRTAGLDPGPLDLVSTSAAATALNDVTKTNGVAGAAVFLRRAGVRDEPRGPTVAAYVLATITGDLTAATTILVVLGLLASGGHLSAEISTAAVVYFVLMTAKVSVIVAALHSRATVRTLFRIPTRCVAWVRRRPVDSFDTSAADDLFDATVLMRHHLRLGGRVVAHSVAGDLIGIVTLWASLHAVGAHVDPIVPVVGYAVAMLFSNVSFVPGGVGLVELGLGAVLVAYGVSGATAAAAILISRLFQLWLPLAFGAWCARSHHSHRLGWAPRDGTDDFVDDRTVAYQHLT
jgi:uncharacterized membrane protein YbhN (UPF0104 family)